MTTAIWRGGNEPTAELFTKLGDGAVFFGKLIGHCAMRRGNHLEIIIGADGRSFRCGDQQAVEIGQRDHALPTRRSEAGERDCGAAPRLSAGRAALRGGDQR